MRCRQVARTGGERRNRHGTTNRTHPGPDDRAELRADRPGCGPIVQRRYGSADVLAPGDVARPTHRCGRGAGPGPRRRAGPGDLAPDGRACPTRPGSSSACGHPGTRFPASTWRGSSSRWVLRHPVPARRRGLRHRQGVLRRVRRGPGGQAADQAPCALLRAGRRRGRLGAHRAAGAAATSDAWRPANASWSSARRAAWAPSRCRSPRRSGPRSPGSAAPPRSTWFVPSAPTTSSTTPVTRWAPTAGSYDLILDMAGNAPLSRLRRALAPRGTLVIGGGEGGGRLVGGLDRQFRALLLSPFVRQRLRMLVAKEHHAGLDRLAALVDDGRLVPVVDRAYPLRRRARGHAAARGGPGPGEGRPHRLSDGDRTSAAARRAGAEARCSTAGRPSREPALVRGHAPQLFDGVGGPQGGDVGQLTRRQRDQAAGVAVHGGAGGGVDGVPPDGAPQPGQAFGPGPDDEAHLGPGHGRGGGEELGAVDGVEEPGIAQVRGASPPGEESAGPDQVGQERHVGVVGELAEPQAPEQLQACPCDGRKVVVLRHGPRC